MINCGKMCIFEIVGVPWIYIFWFAIVCSNNMLYIGIIESKRDQYLWCNCYYK